MTNASQRASSYGEAAGGSTQQSRQARFVHVSLATRVRCREGSEQGQSRLLGAGIPHQVKLLQPFVATESLYGVVKARKFNEVHGQVQFPVVNLRTKGISPLASLSVGAAAQEAYRKLSHEERFSMLWTLFSAKFRYSNFLAPRKFSIFPEERHHS
eukprot:GHVU01039217.1.p2 GENE.GHVU01039217.1~~GHVU01039217.1.p2  ORF type:complete len:156 (+),score=10.70 GHVU01039217.1:1282-1749(+)